MFKKPPRLPYYVLGIYLLLVVVMTWPVSGRIGSQIPGLEGDSWNHLWTFWWVKQALLRGESPFFSQLLFYPNGVSLLFHNIAWVQIALWLVVQVVVGEGAAYTLVFLATYLFNGFATYLLARELTKSEAGAFIAGLIVAFWPYNLSQQDHPNLILIGWIPLTLLCWQRLSQEPRPKWAIWGGVCLALVGLSRWQVLVMAAVPLGLFALWRWREMPWRLLLLSGGLAGLFMAPLFVPLVIGQLGDQYPQDIFVEAPPAQTDLLAYVVPGRYHPVWGAAVYDRFYQSFDVNRFFVPSIGYTTLLLALLGVWWRWRPARGWLVLAILLIVLALGPTLRINGRDYGPMPYTLIQDFFLVRLLRHTDRWNVLLGLPFGLLAAWGVAGMGERYRWLWLPAGLLILIESIVTFPTLPLTVPPWYVQLAQLPGDFAILDVPMAYRADDKRYMFFQMTHGKALVGGHVSRLPAEALAFIEQSPLLTELADRGTPSRPDVSRQLAWLAAADIRYIVLHRDTLSREQELGWANWLARPPIYQDEWLTVYETFRPGLPIAQQLIDGVGLAHSLLVPTETVPGGWVLADLTWGATMRVDQDYQVCLAVTAGEGPAVVAQCGPLAPLWPTGEWAAGERVFTHYALQIPAGAEHGSYTVTATLMDGAQAVGQPAVVGQLQLSGTPRTFEPPNLATISGSQFGTEIVLYGYEVNTDPDRVNLTLYWQAEQAMTTSYKYFVHLLDTVTGQPVTQADGVPRNWSYPTTAWLPGEFVSDTVSLDLSGVPAGNYQLVIGLYDPDSGRRLPLHPSYPNDALPIWVWSP